MYHSSHTERLKEKSHQRHERYAEAHHHNQAFHKSHTSMGAVGHWIRTAGILAPLIIGEFIKDPDKKWRAVRIASVATALVSEGLYTNKVKNDRDRARERELECELML